MVNRITRTAQRQKTKGTTRKLTPTGAGVSAPTRTEKAATAATRTVSPTKAKFTAPKPDKNVKRIIAANPRTAGPSIANVLSFIFTYGQSNSLGSTGGTGSTVVDTDSYDNILMFNGGTTPWVQDAEFQVNSNRLMGVDTLTSTTVLSESLVLDDYGSTGMLGIGSVITASVNKALLTGLGKPSGLWSDTESDDIAPGSLNWSNLMLGFQQAKAAADADGIPLVIPACWFDHGESETTLNEAQYIAVLDDVVVKLQSHGRFYVKDLSLPTIPIIVKQLAHPDLGGADNSEGLMLASVNASVSNPNIYCAGPDYWTPKEDGLHRSSLGHRLYGELVGQVILNILNGQGWEPTRVDTINRTGTTITITCVSPDSALVIDTTTITDAVDAGFQYTGANITDVSVNGLTITITLDADAAGTLRYAMQGGFGTPVSGSRGNIRGDTGFIANHDSSTIHHWLCAGKWDL